MQYSLPCTMRLLSSHALALLAVVACGGGGSSSSAPAQPSAALVLTDAVLGVQDLTVALELSIADIPSQASLLQFDFAVDALRLRPARSRPNLEMVQTVPTADSQVLRSGELRVLFGDGADRDARELQAGVLLRLYLEPVEPRIRGEVVVVMRNLLLVGGDGEVVPLAANQVLARITIR